MSLSWPFVLLLCGLFVLVITLFVLNVSNKRKMFQPQPAKTPHPERRSMTMSHFTQQSQTYLAELFQQSHFDTHHTQEFGPIVEPVVLSGVSYHPYFFKPLTGYKPTSTSRTFVKYTFFLLKPPEDLKQRFIEEVEKQRAGQAFDEQVIGDYYVPVFPGASDFQALTDDLTVLLQTQLFPAKGYQFAFHLCCPTADHDFAIVFLEMKSVSQTIQDLPDGTLFEKSFS